MGLKLFRQLKMIFYGSFIHKLFTGNSVLGADFEASLLGSPYADGFKVFVENLNTSFFIVPAFF